MSTAFKRRPVLRRALEALEAGGGTLTQQQLVAASEMGRCNPRRDLGPLVDDGLARCHHTSTNVVWSITDAGREIIGAKTEYPPVDGKTYAAAEAPKPRTPSSSPRLELAKELAEIEMAIQDLELQRDELIDRLVASR